MGYHNINKMRIPKAKNLPDTDLDEVINEILEISLNVHTDTSNIPVSESYGDKHGYAREDVVIKAKDKIRALLTDYMKGTGAKK